MARYLVIGDQTLSSPALLDELRTCQSRESSRFHVVVPASHPPRTWTWNEGSDHASAERQLRQILAQLSSAGLEATGEVGDPSAVRAVGDVLLREPGTFDEIILSTQPPGVSRRVGQDVAHRVERSFSLPVRHLTTSLTRAYRGQEIPGAGVYLVDPSHSSVEFVARFLMISKVRGRFADFSGSLRIAEQPEESSVDFDIDATTISTGERRRDAHLRSADFLDVERFPRIGFRSSSVSPGSEQAWRVTGDLELRGLTRTVELDVELTGVAGTEWGEPRAGFAASTEIDREEWGLTWNQPLETGGVLIGRRVQIELNIQAVRATSATS